MENPTCFLSYSWDNPNHKKWVLHLATELQKNGIETKLDQWDTHLGMDLPKYMEESIRKADFVLLICTPTFCEKANSGSGGVGYEKCIVTGEIFNDIASPKKFIPILRNGKQRESLPSYLISKLFIDFRNDDEFNLKLEELLRHLHQSPKHIKPPLGKKPSFNVTQTGLQKSKPIKQKRKKRISIASFKEIRTYAYSPLGLDLSKNEAVEFAKKWMRKK